MKLKTLLSLSAICYLSLSTFAAELTVDSSITRVSLFRDGAMVSRQGSLQVPAGKSTLIFNALPSNIDATALQANLLNSPKGIIRNAKATHLEDPEDHPALKELEEKLDETKLEASLQKRLIAEAKAEVLFAQNMAKSFAGEFGKMSDNGTRLSLNDAKELRDLIASTNATANATIDSATEALKEIEKRIDAIEDEIDETEEDVFKLTSIAEVEIEMAEASEIVVELSYLASEALWIPRYELRAHPDQKSLDFGYLASVRQDTGEDWTDVTLSLHTNNANRMGNVPELYALKLDQRRAAYMKRSMSVSSSAAVEEVFELSPFAIDDEANAGARSNTIVDSRGRAKQVAVSSSTVSFQAIVPGKVTVVSSRDEASYKILETSLETEYWSEVVPKIQLDTYLKGKLKNTLDLPILPGIALAFVDGKLSSKVAIKKTLPNEELELSFGTDQNVIVKRKEGSQEDKNSGFLDKTKTLNREYVNTVTNFHDNAHKVIIVDQFPIAQNAKIEIKRLTPTETEATFEDDNDGIFKWESELKSEETKTFTTSFQVTYPRDWDLQPDI